VPTQSPGTRSKAPLFSKKKRLPAQEEALSLHTDCALSKARAPRHSYLYRRSPVRKDLSAKSLFSKSRRAHTQ